MGKDCSDGIGGTIEMVDRGYDQSDLMDGVEGVGMVWDGMVGVRCFCFLREREREVGCHDVMMGRLEVVLEIYGQILGQNILLDVL